ncbi:MAG: RraA family protein [Planctomycetes bacterium]|nr:RraA family protein [Planctomycetota bacterium]
MRRWNWVRVALLVALLSALAVGGAPGTPKLSVTTVDQVQLVTSAWAGERLPDGRPRVPDDILRRMKNVSLEEAWAIIRNEGYRCQFEGGWQILHQDVPVVGRALTAQYMPARPDLKKLLDDTGKAEGRVGSSNSWPIDMLQKGDVYVADGMGKVVDGTLIGDNLGNSIFAKSGNGVIFDGSVRDIEGLGEIEGFNVFARGWDPSFIQDMMLTGINVPIRIGRAICLPGDVVLAKREGVIFIPAQLAEKVVKNAEAVMLRDRFGHQRLKEGKYTPGQIDGRWSEEIRKDFFQWLEQNKNDLPVPKEAIQEILDKRTW